MENYHCEDAGKEYCLLRELFPSERIESIEVSESREHVIGEGALEDISDGCKIDCIRKKLASQRYNRRQIEQLMCIEDYRVVLSGRESREVDSAEAAIRWVVDGFAEVFAGGYANKKSKHEIIRHHDLYVDSEKEVNGR